eukprot:343837-Pyramimonas_sp.AAC.1
MAVDVAAQRDGFFAGAQGVEESPAAGSPRTRLSPRSPRPSRRPEPFARRAPLLARHSID